MAIRRGFTLIELMIAVAILAIVAAIAVPAYNGYIRESRLGALRMNLDTLRIAVEAFRLDSQAGNYGNATYTGVTAISNQYGWKPEGDGGIYAYKVVASSVGPTYQLSVVDSNAKVSYCCSRTAAGNFSCKDAGTTPSCP